MGDDPRDDGLGVTLSGDDGRKVQGRVLVDESGEMIEGATVSALRWKERCRRHQGESGRDTRERRRRG